MHIDSYGVPAAIGVLLIAAGATLRHHRGKAQGKTQGKAMTAFVHRLNMALFLAGAFFLALGVLPWQRALAALTGTGAGLVVLLIVAFFAAAGLWHEARHQHMMERARALIFAAVTGTSLLLLVANSARLLREAARSPGQTGRALAQSVHVIASGQAGHPMKPHHALLIAAIGAVAVAGLLALAGRSGAGKGKGGPLAITSGQPPLPAQQRRGR